MEDENKSVRTEFPPEGSLSEMSRATDCVASESCSIEEAQDCLYHLSEIKLDNLANKKAIKLPEVIAAVGRKLESENKELTKEQTHTGRKFKRVTKIIWRLRFFGYFLRFRGL